ncbi:hypothetical protein [Streptomyces sp. NBC_01190]|uniref:hypothetical protein n=1 Tax=Streptomyces sp. NBC_01190 TaxID=2903767 RepID=UPI0038689249|nr:hypothetical protein OG519_11200 [Streptomyces sp. NBC_01190]
MPKNRVALPTCLPIVLRLCAGRDDELNLPHGNGNGNDAPRRQAPGSGRPDRAAWQSPYGPPPHRTHRGRWAPWPGLTGARSALRRGFPCGRCD